MDFGRLDDERLDLESLDEGPRLGRRSFLIGAMATTAAMTAPVNYAAIARKRRIPIAKHGEFDLGVASGLPRPRGIVLWTRVAGLARTSRLTLEVAKDSDFKHVVHKRQVTARSERDLTARAFVRKLKPSTEYYYRFHTKESNSPVGRFRTAPPLGSNKPLRIAFYSCQSYEAGFYNAQRAIAEEPDLDLVLCLGDYIYESPYFPNGPRFDRTGANGDGDVQTLAEFRQKYRLYKSDPDLQAMHAAHPFVCVWDDHEAEDNYAGEKQSSAAKPGQTNNDLPQRVPFGQRRANGYRAFFNYMPRLRYKGDRDRIFENVRLGGLVDLILTDERQYRDQQPCKDALVEPCPESKDPRTMLGARQKAWVKQALAGSHATWKVWGNQLMLMSIDFPAGSNAINDSWDGYAAERQEILDFVVDQGIRNVTALTGDIHNFFAGTATTTGDQGGRPAAAEFVGGAATSYGIPEELGPALGLPAGVSVPPDVFPLLTANNPHFKFADYVKRGYGVVEVTPTRLTCEFKQVDAKTQGAKPSRLAKFQVAAGSTTVEQI